MGIKSGTVTYKITIPILPIPYYLYFLYLIKFY